MVRLVQCLGTGSFAGATPVALQNALLDTSRRATSTGYRLTRTSGLEVVRPTVIKLRSLAVKGQVFKFDGYTKCQNAVALLTWQFDRIQAFTAVSGSPTWNWEHPKVLKHLKDMMAIDPDEIRKSAQENNVALLEFASETYGRVYGGVNRRHFFW